MGEKLICINCGKEYKSFCLSNYNLDLCSNCFENENDLIERNIWVDEVTHIITCPLCGAKYGLEITDKKCKTPNCPVHFFWDDLDSVVFAKWVKK